MKILGRYVFREILAGSILAIVIATFVIFMQGVAPLFELLVRTKRMAVAFELIGLSLLPVLNLSIPFGILVGILIGLGRMSGDNEMVALRSTGISTRVVVTPVLLFAFCATLVSGACAVWFNPLAVQHKYVLLNKVKAEQFTGNVAPRIFQEQFTNDNTVLYIDDVVGSGRGPALWRRVFIADMTPPSDRKSTRGGQPNGPMVTLAREATAIPDQAHGRVQLHMVDESTHETSMDEQKGEKGIHTLAPSGEMALNEAPPKEQSAKPFSETLTPDLRRYLRTAVKGSQKQIDATLELQKRFALPVACIMLAMVGIPLGTSSRRGGRSSGYVWAILLCFCCYYLAFISLTNAAQNAHSINPVLASWLPNIVFGIAGIITIALMETPGDRDLLGGVRTAASRWFTSLLGWFSTADTGSDTNSRKHTGLVAMFRVMDSYVLSSFLLYFVLWICAFVLMIQIYNFFELVGDIVKNNVPMPHAARYHLYLTPMLIYTTLPFGVLLSVLVTFGVMTKNNEVTAFKACGISVRRLGLPVILMSLLISGAAFAADYSWIPRANQIQDSLRNEIKGRPAQTYKNPDRKWVFHDNRVFYFRRFDIAQNVMVEPFVYEIDPKTWQLIRQINAKSARWQPDAKAWIFEQGQVIDLCQKVQECRVSNFTATSFPEITETPENFLKEVRQNLQMNYVELKRYIADLKQSGFDTTALEVQYYEKFAVPLFALTIALISVPFGFLVGNRGAMAGVGVSIALAVTYLGVDKLFEQMGNVGYLPADVAAWSPDTLFSLTGLYLLLRMRS